MTSRIEAYLATALGEGDVVSLDASSLPERPVLVRVDYSDLNYKDALAITGRAPILRSFPIVPGIDLAGEVLEDSSNTFKPGDTILAIGHGLGESEWGGYASRQRIPPDGVLKMPSDLDSKRAMQFGTAGLTAALCVQAILELEPPRESDLLVTGATGGVGSVAVLLLAALGFRVVAATGRSSHADYLKMLGAADVISRSELQDPGKPLDRQRWFGAVETVGGKVLSGCLRHTAEGGIVAACGMAGGHEFTTSVFPFILRNVRLVGVLSFFPKPPELERAWKLLADHVEFSKLDTLTTEISLAGLREASEKMLANQTQGRILIRPTLN